MSYNLLVYMPNGLCICAEVGDTCKMSGEYGEITTCVLYNRGVKKTIVIPTDCCYILTETKDPEILDSPECYDGLPKKEEERG